MFNFQLGSWPIKYLGVPVSVSARRNYVHEMGFSGERLKKMMDGWMRSSLSIRGGLSKLMCACQYDILSYVHASFA